MEKNKRSGLTLILGDPAEAPPLGGAYIMQFQIDAPTVLQVGALGMQNIPAGIIRYYGSAYGPGGIRARLLRHLRRDKSRRRHVDYLTALVRPAELYYIIGGSECDLAQTDIALGWAAPIPGFGASDCRRCPAHLLLRP